MKEKQKENHKEKHELTPNYFTLASSWSDDWVSQTLLSKQRYKLLFIIMSSLCALLVIAIILLTPLVRTQLIVVHEGVGGQGSWVSVVKNNEKIPISWARAKNEIAHYVISRESYDPLLYKHNLKLVKLFSNKAVESQYILEQSDNKSALINTLGAKGYRTVDIKNILPLDLDKTRLDDNNNSKNGGLSNSANSANLAKVDFEVIDHFIGSTQTVCQSYSAIISWDYLGAPADPEGKFNNWDGFLVTKYIRQAGK